MAFFTGTAVSVGKAITYAQVYYPRFKWEKLYSTPSTLARVGYAQANFRSPLSFSEAPTFPAGTRSDIALDWRDYLTKVPAPMRKFILDNVAEDDEDRSYNPVLTLINDATLRLHCWVTRARVIRTLSAQDYRDTIQKDWRGRTPAKVVLLLTYVCTTLQMYGILLDVPKQFDELPKRMQTVTGFVDKVTASGAIQPEVWLRVPSWKAFDDNFDGLCMCNRDVAVLKRSGLILLDKMLR